MKPAILIRPEAEADVDEACGWYEQRRRGLGAEFLLCVEETLEKICRNPEIYPVVYSRVRRGMIRRFPYGVFYLIEGGRILVVGVFHARRDPRRWRSRA